MQDSLINNLLYVTRQPFAVKQGLDQRLDSREALS
jgi:hypothetical protein